MDERITRGYRAVEVLYHAYLTGLILTTVSRRGGAAAAELVFRTFRRQHLEKFLPGLEKLGLAHLPHAVACAVPLPVESAGGRARRVHVRVGHQGLGAL